jgi:hypothetical protein
VFTITEWYDLQFLLADVTIPFLVPALLTIDRAAALAASAETLYVRIVITILAERHLRIPFVEAAPLYLIEQVKTLST